MKSPDRTSNSWKGIAAFVRSPACGCKAIASFDVLELALRILTRLKTGLAAAILVLSSHAAFAAETSPPLSADSVPIVLLVDLSCGCLLYTSPSPRDA